MNTKFDSIKNNFIKVYDKDIECDIPPNKIFIHNVDQTTLFIYNIDDISDIVNDKLVFKYRFQDSLVKKIVYIDKNIKFARWGCGYIFYPFSKQSEYLIDNLDEQYNYNCHYFLNPSSSSAHYLKASVILLIEKNDKNYQFSYYISKKMYKVGMSTSNKYSPLIDLLNRNIIEKRNKEAEMELGVILNTPIKTINFKDDLKLTELQDGIELYNYQKADIKWMSTIKSNIDNELNTIKVTYNECSRVMLLKDPNQFNPILSENRMNDYLLCNRILVTNNNNSIDNKTIDIKYIGGNIISEIGTGKCHKINTKILMSDGTVKKVQNIKEGELLMGDDSTPRKVLTLARGRDIMYDIIPTKGEKYTVNQEHILCLKISKESLWFKNNKIKITDDIIEIAVKDYIKLPESIKKYLKGYKVSVDFEKKELPLDAYIMGSQSTFNEIPYIYKCNSREIRLNLLAGLIDSNYSILDNMCIKIKLKKSSLVDDVLYLCRSLGIGCELNNELLIIYGGTIINIPTLKFNKIELEKAALYWVEDVLMTDINVIEVGVDNYYGFEISGNKRYLISDFTVTHNTLVTLGYLIKNFTNDYDKYITFENNYCNYFYKRGKMKGCSCKKNKVDELYCLEHSKTIFIDKRSTVFNKNMIDETFSIRSQIIEVERKKLFKSNATLILCPNHLCDQWIREYYEKFKQNNKSKRILLIVTYDQYSNITFGELLFADLIIVSYDFLNNKNYLKRAQINRYTYKPNVLEMLDNIDHELNNNDTNNVLNKFNVKLNILDNFYYTNIILDECHELKTFMFDDLKLFKSKYRWNITATPFTDGLTSFINSTSNITSNNFDCIYYRINADMIRLFSQLYRRNTKNSIKNEYTSTIVTDTLKLLTFTEQERRIYDAHSLNKNNNTKDYLIKLCCDTSIDIETKNLVKNCKTLDEIESVILQHNKKKLIQLQKIIDEYINKIKTLEEQLNIGYIPILGFKFEMIMILTIEDLRTTLGNTRRTLTVTKKEYNDINRTYKFLSHAIKNIKTSDVCPICLDDILDDIAITKCGHKFCKDCIDEYIKEMCKSKDTRCPSCNICIKVCDIYLLKENDEPIFNEIKDNVDNLDNIIQRVKSTKIGNIIYFIKNQLKNTDKCIIFSQWDTLLIKIGKLLTAENINVLFCNGTIYQKNKSIKSFQKDTTSQIICLSSENCASGINLTSANKIIIVEPTYGDKQKRIDIENQASGRACRIGQKRPVEIIRFIIKDTIEEYIYYDNEKELNYNINPSLNIEPFELNNNVLEI